MGGEKVNSRKGRVGKLDTRMGRSIILATFIGVIVAAIGANATQYFVSPNGSSSGSGTTEAAPLTLESANSKLVPGDTMTLLDGTYPWLWIPRSGTSSAWITVRAKNRRMAILSGAATSGWSPEWNCLNVSNVSYVKIVGIGVQGWNPNHDVVSSGHGIAILGSHHILIQDCRVMDAPAP
ncbi:MAG: hypothetical protein PHC61_03675 [Chitinivibrionales bacterium]|nr:hypothetical protein [Chitinivibrionales bacterium]